MRNLLEQISIRTVCNAELCYLQSPQVQPLVGSRAALIRPSTLPGTSTIGNLVPKRSDILCGSCFHHRSKFWNASQNQAGDRWRSAESSLLRFISTFLRLACRLLFHRFAAWKSWQVSVNLYSQLSGSVKWEVRHWMSKQQNKGSSVCSDWKCSHIF